MNKLPNQIIRELPYFYRFDGEVFNPEILFKEIKNSGWHKINSGDYSKKLFLMKHYGVDFSNVNDFLNYKNSKKNDFKKVQYLISGEFNLSKNDWKIILMTAIEYGWNKVIEFIPPQMKFIEPKLLCELLICAVKNNNIEIIKLFYNRQKSDFVKMLHYIMFEAAEIGNLDIIKYFIESCNIPLNIGVKSHTKTSAKNCEKIWEVAIRNNRIEMIKYLFQLGYIPGAGDIEIAFQCEFMELLEILLSREISVNNPTRMVIIAAKQKSMKLLKYLEKNGLNISQYAELIIQLLHGSDCEMLHYIFKKVNIGDFNTLCSKFSDSTEKFGVWKQYIGFQL